MPILPMPSTLCDDEQAPQRSAATARWSGSSGDVFGSQDNSRPLAARCARHCSARLRYDLPTDGVSLARLSTAEDSTGFYPFTATLRNGEGARLPAPARRARPPPRLPPRTPAAPPPPSIAAALPDTVELHIYQPPGRGARRVGAGARHLRPSSPRSSTPSARCSALAVRARGQASAAWSRSTVGAAPHNAITAAALPLRLGARRAGRAGPAVAARHGRAPRRRAPRGTPHLGR